MHIKGASKPCRAFLQLFTPKLRKPESKLGVELVKISPLSVSMLHVGSKLNHAIAHPVDELQLFQTEIR